MGNVFDQFDPVVRESYRDQGSLRNIVQLTPEETQRDEAFDRSPGNLAELDRQIEAYRNDPAKRSLLEAERVKLGGYTPTAFAKPNIFDQFDAPKTPVEPRSLVKEIPIQTYAGATINLPKQIGQALQWMSEPGHTLYDKGRELQTWAEDREKANPDLAPQLEGRSTLGRILTEGARALIPSAAVMVPAAIGAAAAPAVGATALVGGAAGAAAGAFGMFGASQAQETYDKLVKSGVPEPEARQAGWINLMIEGGGETIGDIAGMKLFGMLGKAAIKGASPVANAITGATDTAVLKPFLKQLPKTAAVETATEFGQNYGEAWVEQKYGSTDPTSPLEQGVHGAETALGMTLLLAPFGLAGFAHRARQNGKIAEALTNPEAPEAHRIAASKIVFDQINAVNPDAARAWSENSSVAITAKAPILLDEQFATPKEPTVEDVTTAPSLDAAIESAARVAEAPVPDEDSAKTELLQHAYEMLEKRAQEDAAFEEQKRQNLADLVRRTPGNGPIALALREKLGLPAETEPAQPIPDAPWAEPAPAQATVEPRLDTPTQKLPDTPEQAQAMSSEHLQAARDLSRSDARRSLIDDEIQRRAAPAAVAPEPAAPAASPVPTILGSPVTAFNERQLGIFQRAGNPSVQQIATAELARRSTPVDAAPPVLSGDIAASAPVQSATTAALPGLQSQQTPALATNSAALTPPASATPAGQPAAVAPAITPIIGGKPVTDFTPGQLATYAAKGSERNKAIALAEIERRGLAVPAAISQQPGAAATGGAPATSAKPAKMRGPRNLKEPSPSNNLLKLLAKIGGVNTREALDITGERNLVKNLGGLAARAFRKDGRGLDDVALYLSERGWLTPRDLEEVDGGVQKVRDMIAEAVNGTLGPVTDRDAQAVAGYEARDREEREREREAEEAVQAAGGEPTPDNVLDAGLVADAVAIDPDMVDRLADEYANDDHAFMAAVREFMNGRANQNANAAQSGQNPRGEAQGTQADAARADEGAGGSEVGGRRASDAERVRKEDRASDQAGRTRGSAGEAFNPDAPGRATEGDRARIPGSRAQAEGRVGGRSLENAAANLERGTALRAGQRISGLDASATREGAGAPATLEISSESNADVLARERNQPQAEGEVGGGRPRNAEPTGPGIQRGDGARDRAADRNRPNDTSAERGRFALAGQTPSDLTPRSEQQRSDAAARESRAIADREAERPLELQPPAGTVSAQPINDARNARDLFATAPATAKAAPSQEGADPAAAANPTNPMAEALRKAAELIENVGKQQEQAKPEAAPRTEPPADTNFSRSTFRRTTENAKGIPLADARAVVSKIRMALPGAPPIHIIENLRKQTPEALLSQIKEVGAENDVDAAFHMGDIYVFPQNLKSVEEAEFIIAHHEIRHWGLRGLLGPQRGPTLLNIYGSNAGVKAKADEIRDSGRTRSTVEAIEEVLADTSLEEMQKLKGIERLVAAIRSTLRAVAQRLRTLGMRSLADLIEPKAWTDSDVLNLVRRAEDLAQSGNTPFAAGGTAFAQNEETPKPPGQRSNKQVGASFDAILKGIGRQELSEILYNWNESELTEDGDIRSYPGRDGFYSKGKDGGKVRVSKREFLDWLTSDAPFDPKVYGETIEPEWRGSIERARAALTDNTSMFHRSPAAAMGGPIAQTARDTVADIFTSSRTFNRWFHGTVGTQQHKARINADFARVYNGAQDFLGDTSRYANEAANLAPDLLPKIDSIKDLAKNPAAAKDVEAVAEALYEGTLYGNGSPLEGLVWTDEELRGNESFGRPLPVRFNMTDKQIALYRQALAASGKSMDELGKALILKHARRYGLDVDREMSTEDVAQEVRQGLNDAMDDIDAHLPSVRDRLAEAQRDVDEEYNHRDPDERTRHFEAVTQRDKLQGREQALALRREEMAKAQSSIDDIESKTNALKEHGYFPAMRFGRYAVQVMQDGEQAYFGMYENQYAANKAARELAKDYQGATINQGVMSKEGWRLYQGLSLDALQLFAEHMTDESGNPLLADPLIQGFLRAATNERSVLKRHIHRKGIEGFSKDIPRVLSQFTLSSARATSANYHMADMLNAANEIKAGDVKDEAVKLVKYLQDPQEEAAWVRGFLFFNFLGGSIASAAVNMTQPFMVTAPYLSQHTTYADAVAKITRAAKDFTANSPMGAHLKEALAKAKEEGIVSPQEIHQLRAEAERPVGGNIAVRKFMHVWGSLFSLAEQFNRATTFIAAYRIAQEKSLAEPYDFAKRAVEDTQFVYNKGSRPNWARGTIGATVFTFKQFSISYIELAKRLYSKDKKAFALMMLTLFVMAGAEGLPFAEDIEDVIDTIGQWLGYGTNAKKTLHRNIAAWLGKDAGDFVLKGVSGIPGVPLDVANRLGMHNLIPGTSIGKPSEKDKLRDIQEIIGPVGGLLKAGGQSAQNLAQGKYGDAAKGLLPSAIQNMLKGLQMAQTGEYRDGQGRKVVDTTDTEAAFKALGFQPNRVARQTETVGIVQQDINLHRLREDGIADKWAQGIADKDPVAVQAAREELRDWNEKNPDMAIRIQWTQIARRVREMKLGREERFIKSAPKELRGDVRKELQR